MGRPEQRTWDSHLDSFLSVIYDYREARATGLPLCAAETTVSGAVKVPLGSDLQERYIMGGVRSFNADTNFVGSTHLHSIYQEVGNACATLYGASYADPRPLSGVHSVLMLLMSLTQPGDDVIVSSPDSGGHPSMVDVCQRLGLQVHWAPYDYDEYDYDYTELSRLASEIIPQVVLLAPSDILFAPRVDLLEVPTETTIIYDATQTLGLIAGKVLSNPLDQVDGIVLCGGTHKTLPGPSSGLIMTNAENVVEGIDNVISPRYVRNTHMHHVAALALTLIEAMATGQEYSKATMANARVLARELQELGVPPVQARGEQHTSTHQIFLEIPCEDARRTYSRSIKHAVSINIKEKRLFHGCGLRVGVQDVTRFGWGPAEMSSIARVLTTLVKRDSDDADVKALLKQLPIRDQAYYTFDDASVERIRAAFTTGP